MAHKKRILALLFAALLIAPATGQEKPAPDSGFLPFAVFDSREVKELFREAQSHLDAERWVQGVSALQRILEDHADDVWSPSGKPGQYLGACVYAEEWLARLPEPGLQAYQHSFGAQARAALEDAKNRRDPAALLQTIKRFANTHEGREALRVLADFHFERGEWAQARRLLSRWMEDATALESPQASAVLRRLGFLHQKLAEAQALEALAARWETQDEELGKWLRACLAQIPISLPAPEARGLAAAVSPALPMEPSGVREIGWRYSEREGMFERPFSSELGVPDPLYNLHATLTGDRVLVSDSLALACLDLFTGKEIWRFAGASGWERIRDAEKRSEFFGAGINPHTTVAGAANLGIAVFPLQVPLKLHENETFQGIPIKTIIPTRRLFALDLASGRPLWNHWRPELARLGRGELVDQTSVASPPLVVGDRVYAAISRMEGKIDYYLASFDLRSGKLVWKTPIVTGQLELNMFGRPIREFAGSPLFFQDGNLYFSTNLGVNACVDAFHGRIRWISRYDQIPIPPAVSFQRAPRNFFWANQPPVVDQETLFVTPLDSEYLYALRAENGEMITRLHFNRPESSFKYAAGLRHLLGVADGRLIVTGAFAYAFATRPGMGVPLFSPLWRRPLLRNDFTRSSLLPRGTITDRSVAVPEMEGLQFLSLEDGTPLPEPPAWQNRERDRGNLLITRGITLSLSESSIEARFDWNSLLSDARRLSASEDPEDLERLGRLLRRRGDALLQQGPGNTEAAIPFFAEASQILEKLAARGRAGAEEELAGLTMSLGELEERRGRFAEAIGHYRSVRQRAPQTEMRLTAALHLASLFKRKENREAFEAALEDLRTQFGSERRRIEGEGDVPIALHALLAKHQFHSSKSEWAKALSALQEILLRYGAEQLENELASDYARDGIAAILRAAGREVYAPFEAQAKEALDQQLQRKDREGLLELIRNYPNALAVSRAYRALAEMSLESGDAATVASVCRRYLAGETEAEGRAMMLRRMAAAFERTGNSALSRALLAKMSRQFPNFVSEFPADEGKPYRDLGRPFSSSRREVPSPRTPLRASPENTLARSSLGVMPVLGDRPEDLGLFPVFADQELLVYQPAEAGGIEKPLWRLTLAVDPEEVGQPVVALTGTRLTIASGRKIQGFDARSGEPLWSRTIPSTIADAFCREGVFLYLLRERRGSFRCEALDAYAGVPLWSILLSADQIPSPVLGDGAIAFLPSGLKEESVPVHDLFTGLQEMRLEVPRVPEILAGAIAQGNLLLAYPPAMSRSAPREERVPMLRGFPLQGDQKPWKAELPSKFTIHSFLFAAEKPYLVLTGRDPRDEEGGVVHAIDAAQGRLAPAATLPGSSFLPGLIPNVTNEIAGHELLALYPESKGFLRASLFDLETGKLRWKRSLPQPLSQLSDPGNSIAPVFTEEILFLPLKMQRPSAAGSRVEVMLIHRKTSETVGSSFSLGEVPPGAEIVLAAFPGMLVAQQGLSLRSFRGAP